MTQVVSAAVLTRATVGYGFRKRPELDTENAICPPVFS